MKLITHNMLQCHVKGCSTNNFPLSLDQVQIEKMEADFNPDFIKRLIPKLEWEAFTTTAMSVSFSVIILLQKLDQPQLGMSNLPNQLPETFEDEEFLKLVHQIALEVI